MPNQPLPQKSLNLKLSKSFTVFAILAYEALVITLLYNELRASSLRATDKTLILLGLIYLPVLLYLVSKFVSGPRDVNLRLPGDLEVKIENLQDRVNQAEETSKDAKELSKKLEERFEGKLSTAEQTLYPIIGGSDPLAIDRLRIKKKLFIGCKAFAANIVIVELVSEHLNFEIQGYECVKKFTNGGTTTNYAYLQNHWIDLIVDYTGTGCLVLNIDHKNIAPEPEKKPLQQLLEMLNERSKSQFNAEWIQILGTKTDYCMVMPREEAEAMNINKISDLSAYKKELRLCGIYEFMNRTDGLFGIKKYYNLEFADESICSYYDRYTLLKENKADITVGLTTDPECQQPNFKILEDDRNFFPDYWECPVVRLEALEIVEGLREALLKLSSFRIDNQDITNLVYYYNENPNSVGTKVKELLERKRSETMRIDD